MAVVEHKKNGLLEKLAYRTGRGRSSRTHIAYDVTIADTPYPDRPDRTAAQVALYNEYGTYVNGKKHVPARPFFSQASHQFAKLWKQKLAIEFKDTGQDPEETLKNMAEYLKLEVQDSIETFSTPENADYTILKKGKDDPLMDSGFMKDSVVVVKVT